ncbi:MAG: serine/threonine protein kinase [Candidatus Competibacteraceae bacterium]
MRKIGRLTASVALNEGLEDIISNATGLSEQQIKDEFQRVRGNTLVRNAFMDYWPYDASRLGRFTVAFACKAGLQEEIAEATELLEEAVVRRLQKENGRKLLINAFKEMTVYDDEDEIEKNDDTNEEEEDAVEAHEDLGQRRVAGVRDDDDAINQLVELLVSISKRTIRGRLKKANGRMLVRNLFANNWPNPGANANNLTDLPQTDAGRPVADDLVANRWKIIRKIGSGGFGTVYEAHDMMFPNNGLVVLKFPNGTECSDSLLKEIGLAYNLNHPNICAYRHIDQDRNRGTFIVLQHGGVSLEKLIEERGVLQLPYAFDVIRQAAAGIDYAHEHNVLHQDIKPGNILVDEKDKKKVRVRISDFGISLLGRRTRRRDMRGPGTVVGTPVGFSPGFASPEQLEEDNTEVSRKSDQYSLALVLCAMLEGEVFNSPYIRRDFARLSDKQNAAIKRALQEKPSERHPSCIDFAKAL